MLADPDASGDIDGDVASPDGADDLHVGPNLHAPLAVHAQITVQRRARADDAGGVERPGAVQLLAGPRVRRVRLARELPAQPRRGPTAIAAAANRNQREPVVVPWLGRQRERGEDAVPSGAN